MKGRFFKTFSLILSIILLINMLPLNVWAEEMDTVAKVETQTKAEPAQAEVLGEVIEKRTQYTKDYRLSNGFYVSAVYAEPVHFEEDGQWEEIDNTLKARSDGTYGNTAGVWDVRFPQLLTKDRNVTITKDGYTLSFGMAGELRNQGNLEIASVGDSAEPAAIGAADMDATVVPTPLETANVDLGDKTETFAVSTAQITSAQILNTDDRAAREAAQYEELVLTKTSSGLMYNNVYGSTDIQYDLQSNKVKESVILESYDADLRGFRYNLDVGELVPVLNDDGSIDFYDAEEENIVMVMPAPFLIDDAMVTSHDVRVVLNGTGSSYTLIYMLPHSWLAEEGRSWPVILDPVVQADPNALTNIQDRTVAKNGSYLIDDVYLYSGYKQDTQINHSYIVFTNLPARSSSDVIVSANLTLQRYGGTSNGAIPIEAHKVNSTWTSSGLTWSTDRFNAKVEDYQLVDANGYYTWNITDLVRDWYSGNNTGVMLKASTTIESSGTDNYSRFYSSDTGYASRMPTLTVLYRNNNGLESYWNYTSASAGRAGTGHVNSYTGNLTWVRDIMSFGGNRMPVSISHVYNLNDRNNNTFGMGNGWRTNFNQRAYTWEQDYNYYIWEDADGTAHYFRASDTHIYKDEDGLELTLRTNVPGEYPVTITDKKGNVSYFDSKGRLAKLENYQQTRSSITITYTTSSGPLIQEIKDGVNRSYKFSYNTSNNSNQLTRIDYYGTDTVIDYTTQFQYTGNNLTGITDNDGKTSIYSYASNSVLSSASDIDGYKLSYEYYEPTSTSTWKPYRVKKVAESHGSDSGGTLTLEYAHNQTTFTDHNQNGEIMQFNDYGNAISIQDGLGRAQYMQFAINNSEEKAEVDAAPQGSDEKNKKPNQLILASRMQNTVSNLLTNTSFESSNIWTSNDTAGVSVSHVGGNSYMGSYSMRLSSTASASTYTGAYSPTFTVASGESVTFSAYVNSTVNGARLGLNYYHNGEYVNHTSAPVATSSWVRAEVSFTNDTNQSLSVAAYVFVPGSGTTYVDCVQVEKMPAASRYNMVQNGDFRSGVNGWSGSAGSITDISIFKNPQNPQESQKSAAPQLSNDVYKMTGSITEERRVSQEIDISGSKDDTFVLAGWAKGNSVPLPKAEDGENQRQFAIIGQFYNETEAVGEEVIAQFNPDTNSSDAWQYAAQPMIADGTFTKIRITLAYDYNANDVFFDGIQLFKEEFGSKYTYNAAGDVSYIENEEGQTIKLKYDSGTNVIAEGEIVEILPNGNETYKPGTQTTYTYDGYHNVLTATSADGRVEEYTYDEWGNIKTASVSGGGMTSTTAYEYANSGNTLAKVTDAVGNETNYVYNAQTSLLTSVRYPNDTDSTKTEYVYNDPMYRTTEVHSTTNTGKAMSANYTYNNDLLASIATPSSTYSFTYGNFGLRESVTVGTKTLAEYTYTATNHYLQSLAYGNNDVVQYTYDKYGRVTEQRHYENGNTTTVDSRVTYQYDNDGALASVFDSATGLTTKYYYDFTGRNGATELRNGADLVFRVSATYDEHNQITSQTRQYASGSYTDTYTYNDNHTLQGMVLGNIRGIGYDYDGIQRIVAMNTGDKTNTDDPNAFAPNGREFTYRDGTNQIARVRYDELMAKRQYPSFDFDYTYDDNGNIATYTSPVESITYTYDSQNQLTSARNTGNGMVFSYEYDAAGNILTATKGGTTYSYTYGNSDWGDLLTAYNGASITYDAIGNPLSYYNGWSFTWQQGREMATATKGSQSLSFTYDADGIRKTKTVNGVVHTYYYSGGKLARETYGSNILDFFYDQNGHPFMLVYNGTVYYYITNAQGDVIRLTDVKGQTAARYQYDPYGNIIDSAGSHVDINPLRYRGYYYDSESGLYYLQSRYYDPNIGRFINADGLITTGHDMLGNNLFAYCNDNPVNLIDPGGNKPGDLFDTMDEAAQNAAYYIGSLSFINGWEYGTNIYTVDVAVNVEVEVIEYVFGENTKITKSTVTVQRTVTKYTYSCEVTSRDPRSVTIPVPPAEINRVAIFHTHPYGSNQGITQLSGKDIAIAQHRGIPMYVYGPNGQMHVYYPQTNITVIWDLFPISTKQPWLQTPSWLL